MAKNGTEKQEKLYVCIFKDYICLEIKFKERNFPHHFYT